MYVHVNNLYAYCVYNAHNLKELYSPRISVCNYLHANKHM